MSKSLVIIDSTGKRAGLSDVLWRAGMRDFDVLATGGQIAANTAGASQSGVTSTFREVAYEVKEERFPVCKKISDAIKGSSGHIYLATDDDDDGHVLARDLLDMVIPKDARDRVFRVLLHALTPSDVKAAFEAAKPLQKASAVKGDARRVFDQLIASLSTSDIAADRVQGSILLCLSEQHPVLGVDTFMASASDGGGPWIAKRPVFAGQASLAPVFLDAQLVPGSSVESSYGQRPMNFGEIILSVSISAGCSIREVAKALQALFDRGSITFPRTLSRSLSRESARRLDVLAQMNGAGFDARRFSRFVQDFETQGHEAPNPCAFDIPLNRNSETLCLTDKVVVHVARNLIDCGIRCNVEQPGLLELQKLPEPLRKLPWHRKVAADLRLYELDAPKLGFQPWTPEQSLLHLMTKNGLDYPATLVDQVGRFLARDLLSDCFSLNAKGKTWNSHLSTLFHKENLGRRVDEYLMAHEEPAPLMVAKMVKKFALTLPLSQ